MYPQAVYFPIRTLYLTLKIEQRERYKSGKLVLCCAIQDYYCLCSLYKLFPSKGQLK